MGDGEISISAYDTAWVALLKNTDGSGGPRFPSSLQWIVHNQLPDGSWGDAVIFSAHDRMINTLACNMWRLREEEAELMPIGFEVAFPSLLDIAKELELEIPYGDPSLQEIDAKRNLKLKRYCSKTPVLHSPFQTYWTEDGICWAKNTRVHEVDDTSMGFRLLRLHGYDVSAGE
ncbi:hypothetical protein B296_00002825 [Ensete ventricosum]|uniref:Terpene synthase N-terminal domain-containing protein n=1 Tax=Ensete ventricosum TaxID=4639 RepID=A0A427A4R5_ENSVE|nr:hypothetical protein B296_00002825 [Ensete ventricosum]